LELNTVAFRLASNELGKKNGHHKSQPQDGTRAYTKQDKPLISFIIPSYMEEKIIIKCLSVFNNELRQKYDFEVILSDGGSSDRTISLAEGLADKIVVHRDEVRQTISGGRNRGADRAEGEVLVFINADSTPQDFEFFLDFIHKWSRGEGEYGHCIALATYVTSFPEETVMKDRIFYTIHNMYVGFLNKLGLGMGRGECQIVRKDFFRMVGGYNESIVAGEDFDLYMRLSKVGKIGFASKIKILESPRRFRKYGYFRVVMSWLANSVAVMVFGRSIAKEWEAVR
jgi:glycosyltransferase involved in cell wall biosynthesis